MDSSSPVGCPAPHPGATPRALTCVGVDVVPEERDGAERLQADVAHVGLLAAVDPHVAVKAGDSRSRERADAAAEGRLRSCGKRTQNPHE